MLPNPLGVEIMISFPWSPRVAIVGWTAVKICSAPSRNAASSKTTIDTEGIPRAALGVAGRK